MPVPALFKDLVVWGVTTCCESLGQDQEPGTHPVRCLARLATFIWRHQGMCACWKGDDGQSSPDLGLLPNQLVVPLNVILSLKGISDAVPAVQGGLTALPFNLMPPTVHLHC